MFEKVGVKLLVLLVFLSSATVFFIVFFNEIDCDIICFHSCRGG